MKDKMQQSKIDREVPRLFQKQATVREQFTTLLMFAEKQGLKRGEWVKDRRLEENWEQLQQKHPSHSSELDWLSYFLVIVKDVSKLLLERQIALAHLKCYYQVTCYWATNNFWENLHKKNFSSTGELIWEWEELFDEATATFDSIEKAEKNFKDFQPERSTKEYVKKVVYYNLSNWRDKKIGRDTRIDRLSLDAYSKGDSQEDNNCFSRSRKIEEVMVQNEKLRREMSFSKNEQDRALALVDSILKKIEQDVGKYKNTKVGKTNIKLWDLLVLTYGLNLLQSGASEVLKLNQIPINQATISRCIKSFALKIQLKIFKEFEREIKDFVGEGLKEEEEPIENLMGDLLKKKKKEVDEVLKDRLQEKVFTLAVMPQERQLKETERIKPIDVLVREELEAWCDRSLQISINSEKLPEKLNGKIVKLVEKFAKQLQDI